MQTPVSESKKSWQIGQRKGVNPAVAGILFLILGAVFIPACSGASVPVASFVSNVTRGTVPLDVQFIDSSTNSPTSWFWSFGDGGTSTVQNPAHTYASSGTYTIILAATNAAGSDTETKNAYITVSKAASAPVAAFVSNETGGIIPVSVQFVDLSTNSPTSWAWSFGDGGSSTLQNPVHTYSASGTFTVTLTATNAGGSSTASKPDYIAATKVTAIPVASFVSSVTEGTAPLTVQFVDSTSNSPTSWIWSFGDGDISTVQNPVHVYNTSDTYTVTLIASNAAGSDTVTRTNYITVTYAIPAANFTSDVVSGSAPLTVQFSDISTNSPTTWSWKFGDGGKSTDQNPTHKYTEPGTYTVSLTAKNSAGSDTSKMTDFITVTTASLPTASFTSDRTSGTIPLTVRFNDTSSNTPTSWRWSFGDGTSSIEQNPVHSYTDAGTYTVALLTANDAGNNTRTMSNYITANSAKALTTGTTAPAATETTRAGETPAAIRTTETAVPASSSSPASPVIFVIAGVVIFIVIAAGVLLYSRNRRGGGHHRGGSQL